MSSLPTADRIRALADEKQSLDLRLDEALRAFADYEEKMNHRWHDADADLRRTLMAERAEVEESLGIVEIVERLDEIRDALKAMGAA
jgi:hypothetical protein